MSRGTKHFPYFTLLPEFKILTTLIFNNLSHYFLADWMLHWLKKYIFSLLYGKGGNKKNRVQLLEILKIVSDNLQGWTVDSCYVKDE